MDISTLVSNLPAPAFKAMLEACVERLVSSSDEKRMTNGEKELCAHGERIKAIKSVRNRLGVGLKEAKDIVDVDYPKPNLDVLNSKYKTYEDR